MTTDWYTSLKHSALLLSPAALQEHFSSDLPPLPDYITNRLRDHITPVLEGDTDAVTPLLRTIFEDILDYPDGQWQRANHVPDSAAHTLRNDIDLRPDWLWQNARGHSLPLFIARPSSQLGIQTDRWTDKRLGVGRSKKAASRVLEWMRRSDTDFALLTNGRQLRLIHARLDSDAWVEWDIDLWFEGGEPGPQLNALRHLLHHDNLVPPPDDNTSTLQSAVDDTREGQAELSDVLGERVRRAVELIIRNVDHQKLHQLTQSPSGDSPSTSSPPSDSTGPSPDSSNPNPQQESSTPSPPSPLRGSNQPSPDPTNPHPQQDASYPSASSPLRGSDQPSPDSTDPHPHQDASTPSASSPLRGSPISNQDIYIAACRLIMRLVVILFAEARDLLPRDNDVYNNAYGLESLYDQLKRRAAGDASRLRHNASAWQRILALFNLVYHGSAHEQLPIPEYGGDLFRPGEQLDSDFGRAIEVLESPDNDIDDETVYRILTLLTRGEQDLPGGGTVEVPVDFSDLSTEYIGIIYEGLLDYELKRADEPMLFLNVGDEPILPFERLEEMTNDQIADLFEELRDNKSDVLNTDFDDITVDLGTDADTDDSAAIEPWQTEQEIADEARNREGDNSDAHAAREAYERIFEWAKKAVVTAGIVTPPDDDAEPDAWQTFERDRTEAARQLAPPERIYLPGRWYLVRWGGTRKGSGTFYTRPQLVFPTVQRTLQPLCYETQNQPDSTHSHPQQDDSSPSTPSHLRGSDRPSPDSTDPHPQQDASTTSTPSPLRGSPKPPEEILDLKVCDPAMGSGSFLIGALRYLTNALFDSLHHHNCPDPTDDNNTIIRLADGRELTAGDEEPIPVPPDHPDFEPRLRARLKRYVVERCIYGVDNDRLAVELARMALWIETMDRELPFGFLDHKLKCGNSLVGAWMDQVTDYPACAFQRSSWNGGDKGHDHGVHFDDDQIGPALKEVRNELMKPQLRNVIRAGADDSFDFMDVDIDPVDIHDTIRELFDDLHDLPVHQTRQRERIYRQQIRQNPEFQKLRTVFDTWCAIWFWPFDDILEAAKHIRDERQDPQKRIKDIASNVLTEEYSHDIADDSSIPFPEEWMDLDDEQRAKVRRLRNQHKFFHWELEFPDVFNQDRRGFDAVVGNPPWEIEKPNSKEFFTRVDPLYRSYGKQEALDHQTEYFEEDPELEREWLQYNAQYKSLSNWCKHRPHPFGDAKFRDHDGHELNLADIGGWWRDSDELHKMWIRQRDSRTGFSDPEHPFRHQGSADTNSYKLFLEMARALDDTDGRLGFIVPSGIYTDYGTQQLRELLINESRWEWLFSFENKQGIFDIHRSFKFCPIIAQKGGQTDRILASFMHHDIDDWADAHEHVLEYPRQRILQFSPNTKSILELRSERDLDILETIYDNGVLLGDDSDDGWGIEYNREFDMTNDSDKFAPRPDFEDKGYRPDEYGHWLKGDWQPIEHFGFDPTQHRTDPHRHHWLPQDRPDGLVLSRDGESALDLDNLEDVALPFYQGVLINQFDFSQKSWEGGTGLQADWKRIGWQAKALKPQYLMRKSDAEATKDFRPTRPIYRRVARNTDTRTIISSLIPPFPCGDKAPVITTNSPITDLAVVSNLNCLVMDWVARIRVAGTQLDFHLMDELPSVESTPTASSAMKNLSIRLNCGSRLFARTMLNHIDSTVRKNWRHSWAITPHERLRKRVKADSLLAQFYGLEQNDWQQILRTTDLPSETISQSQSGGQLPATGFWRVDKQKPPERRHTVLTQVAFQDLEWLLDEMNDRNTTIAIFAGQRHLLDDPPDPTDIPSHPHIDPTEGWQLPTQLTLADYNLGHHERATNPQPVAPELGPRFHDWQTAQDPDTSWTECHHHAQLINQIVPTQPNHTDSNESTDNTQRELL